MKAFLRVMVACVLENVRCILTVCIVFPFVRMLWRQWKVNCTDYICHTSCPIASDVKRGACRLWRSNTGAQRIPNAQMSHMPEYPTWPFLCTRKKIWHLDTLDCWNKLMFIKNEVVALISWIACYKIFLQCDFMGLVFLSGGGTWKFKNYVSLLL